NNMHPRDKDGLNKKRILELVIRCSEKDSFLDLIPYVRCEYSAMKEKYDQVCKDVQEAFDLAKDKPVKEFALTVGKHKYSSIMFSMKRGNYQTVQQFLPYATKNQLEALF